ncbi:hypothetical protein [Arcobacter defluvii]|uniref:Uncharacterized protein n=1 Tax=Arcobacter defluvii TaxID=873191 RepID=A0AAE7BHW5_9BACT|nr:hypothetical protein [Arcobacter defluvii]QKF78054.1 hypothetical protein ADFLV_2039 [Arcobacter defluvii]RXI29998.1 hypothetical protein CP964_12695 [Arcobacter defluvii]
MKKILIILSAVFLISSFFLISTKKPESLFISFYSWENSFDKKDINEKLYIKVLDIAYSTKLEIVTTNLKTTPKDFVPVIYITNETMKNVDYSLVSNAILKTLKNLNFNEVQIDCDWSDSSQSNYFKLLEDLKTKLNKPLSATIRLHQIKYYVKTGIPPVDYGVLMYYNMSDITNIDTKNSILDNDIAKKYHYNFDNYKLKLKLALPLYSQAIQFRENKALSIFEGVERSDFDSNFIEISPNLYKVLNSTYFKGRYIYKDDIFRFEDVKKEDLKIALDDFMNLTKNRFDEIIFYTLKYKNKFDLDNLIKGKI